MRYGVVFPQTEIGPNPADVTRYAQTAEALGYDYLLAYEHVLGANPERPGGWQGPYTHESLFHEPFVLFSYLAALTTSLEFVTGVLILPQRQTVLVAKQAAALDVLSGGRLRLGVGIGWNAVEYEALGEDFSSRGRRSAEQVRLLRQLWAEPLVTFQGSYHTVTDAGLNPLPVQRPIPIWFGGGADRVLRRMARLGDGWIANTMLPEQGRPYVEKLRAALEAAGRDPDTFGIDIRVNARLTPEPEWDAYVAGWRALGATHLCINTMDLGFTDLDQHLDVLRRF
ncbi:MAG: LLM class F420-dependent oxidoreductase, partial [Anaerolineae bacterium]|nr:LLM class F420-dependent oxidoreductase [Anaerolineae bacterium]